MIVNSHPYNPSQQAQQQRCIGINQPQQPHMISSNNKLAGQQQQNALYGSSHLISSNQNSNNNNNMQSSHVLDLMANLQQQHNGFDSAYEDTTSSLVTTTTTTANNLNGSQQNGVNQQNSLVINNNNNQDSQQQQRNLHQQRHSTSNNHDLSQYSPSSSTSLMYHIYDQIYDHQQQPPSKKNALFGLQQQQQQLPPSNTATTTIQLHQQQMSQAAEFQKLIQQQQQSLYSGLNQQQYHHTLQHQQQQPAFTNTLHGGNYLGAATQALDGQLMFDSVIRHQASTLARHHHRPLSSSGASSMSGQSMALTYGRQPRAIAQGKSQTNLASVLQSHHLGSTNGSGLSPTSQPKKFGSHFASGGGIIPIGGGNKQWKRAQQRVRNLAYQYSTIFKCSILLVLLAFSLMSIIKFTIMNPTVNQQQQTSNNQISASSSGNINQLVYPPFKFDQNNNMLDAQMQTTNGQSGPTTIVSESGDLELAVDQQRKQQNEKSVANSPDVLKSKVLIGEFVIRSQNYTHSAAQKLLLAENIVKLMDQVFLSTEVRRFYSRMEVTNIRPNFRPSSGIIVDFNIILSDSIPYAAQQFGFALYDSLAKSNEKLANQQSFIIDKTSIRFNTVPDKDLKLGIVPPGLISDSVTRELVVTASSTGDNGNQLAGSSNQQQPPNDFHFNNNEPSASSDSPINQPTTDEQQQQSANSVVWSEWSRWSSCIDKNGICDSQRLHSRIRKCVAQHTGEKVESIQCKQKYNIQDQDLEVADCSQFCQQQQQIDSRLMSDAPSVVGPQTAPSVLLGSEQPPTFLMPPPPTLSLKNKQQQMKQQQQDLSSVPVAASTRGGADGATLDGYANSMAGEQQANKQQQQQSLSTTEKIIIQQQQQQLATSTLASAGQQTSSATAGNDMLITPISVPTILENQQQQQEQMSCSNCTESEICLFSTQQNVPFCALIKDRRDESGCGGWCKAPNQLCQPVGQNAFKCIQDTECLDTEWRCHNSQCIPLSKRCDGHSNCYDNSDERDCPN